MENQRNYSKDKAQSKKYLS